MLHGIIDIGSNTVRLNVYRVDDDRVEVIFSKKATLGLISYVNEGELTSEGIEKLVTTLKDIKNVLDLLKIESYHFFSTAILRNIKNGNQVTDIIEDQVGIDVDVLSGEEEGELSFYGSLSTLKEDNGILIDLGGGSVELVIFNDRKVTDKRSIPVGSLKMFNKYVSQMLPTEEERELIKERVYRELVKTGLQGEIPFMCGVGGSLRVIKKLSVDLGLISDGVMDVKILKHLEKELKHNDRQTYKRILQVKASRIHTLVPALLITDVITAYFGCEKLQVSEYSIREGYLYKKVLGR
jgi:exopolyphosphatase/guanosine-5'-triphosphate,3'-diphosphate pyrophosphatase